MKKFQFLLLICILTFTVSCGQQKRYISYKVQEGETMRDIANRLDMKTKDLLRLNPDISRKPAANTVIVIPNPEIKTGIFSTTPDEPIVENEPIDENPSDTSETSVTADTIDAATTENTIFQQTVYEYENHTVQAGETVYRITKLYDISKDDLIEWNPDYPTIKNNILSIGQVLKVKSVEKVISINREEVLENFLTHTVKSKETVYSLTRFYNISKEDLIRLNPEYPGIKNNELAIGQLIKIKPIEEVNPNENFAFYKDSIQENAMIDVAILLPFKLKEYKAAAAKDIFSSENNSASLANMVTDFYMGAEIAIDSIKKQGILVNITVFDTGNRDDNVPSILAENKLDSTDVVIGPFYSDKAALIARKVRVPVVFPHFSNSQDKFSATKLIKSAPDKNNYTNYLASYLKDIYKGENVFVVGDGEAASNSSVSTIVSSLKKHDSIGNIHVLKPKDGYIKRELFTDKMAVNKKNWVIITSDDNVAIADVLNSMIGIPDDMTVQVFAVEKNKSYDRIENNKLASINFTYVSNTFEDAAADNVKAFNKKYYQKNNTVASDYAIKGFDITYDILMRLASGKELSQTFKEGVSLRLENKFDYRKKTFSSTSNNGLFIIKYNKDLSLTRLK